MIVIFPLVTAAATRYVPASILSAGILKVVPVDCTELSLVVDLRLQIDERLPKNDTYKMFGIMLRCIGRSRLDAFAEAVYFLAKQVE